MASTILEAMGLLMPMAFFMPRQDDLKTRHKGKTIEGGN
jgi:hypothetical protein